MVKLPIDNRWRQPNSSDKFGSIWASKNLNLDQEGYVKLSPRTVLLVNEDDDGQFGIPVSINVVSSGEWLVTTTDDAVFNVAFSITGATNTENTGTSNPLTTLNSHGVFWNELMFASTATTIVSRPISASDENWTSRVTGLTSGVRHYMAVFASRQTLAVTDDNVVRQYDTSYGAGTACTIPAEFEAIGLAYNNSRIGIITRIGTSVIGQGIEARFFVWDGVSTGAISDAAVGAQACIGVCPYKSSFAILTAAGQLLYWNGGGFDLLAAFPFYFENRYLASFSLGNCMQADGDILYVNLPNTLSAFNRKEEIVAPNFPGGTWCFDPQVGLYHRYSPSISHVYVGVISAIDTSTDIITLSSGTIPPTGSVARLSSISGTSDDLVLNSDYYIIKLTSTTLKLATSRANALGGVAINLTDDTGPARLHLYDIIDYGNSFIDHLGLGAVAKIDQNSVVFTDVMIGGDFRNGADTTKEGLCIGVPFLENRGWLITPKIFSSQVTDIPQKLVLKFRPLKTGDKIVVKYRNRDVLGLPVSSSGDEATWTDSDSFTTAQDLSEAKTYLDAGHELECEFVSGVGGGQMVKVSSITVSGTTYTVNLAESPVGVAQGLKSEFIIDNWEVKHTFTSADTSPVEVTIGGSASWSQFKIELRGVETTIEELQFINAVHRPSR